MKIKTFIVVLLLVTTTNIYAQASFTKEQMHEMLLESITSVIEQKTYALATYIGEAPAVVWHAFQRMEKDQSDHIDCKTGYQEPALILYCIDPENPGVNWVYRVIVDEDKPVKEAGLKMWLKTKGVFPYARGVDLGALKFKYERLKKGLYLDLSFNDEDQAFEAYAAGEGQ